jgi:hypothetical protein
MFKLNSTLCFKFKVLRYGIKLLFKNKFRFQNLRLIFKDNIY